MVLALASTLAGLQFSGSSACSVLVMVTSVCCEGNHDAPAAVEPRLGHLLQHDRHRVRVRAESYDHGIILRDVHATPCIWCVGSVPSFNTLPDLSHTTWYFPDVSEKVIATSMPWSLSLLGLDVAKPSSETVNAAHVFSVLTFCPIRANASSIAFQPNQSQIRKDREN